MPTLIVWFCGVRVGRVPAHVCCPDEKKKMLKALIMSYWVKDLVQKDKLDTALPHLLRAWGRLFACSQVCSEGPMGPSGTNLTFHTCTTLLGAYLFCIYLNRVMS